MKADIDGVTPTLGVPYRVGSWIVTVTQGGASEAPRYRPMTVEEIRTRRAQQAN